MNKIISYPALRFSRTYIFCAAMFFAAVLFPKISLSAELYFTSEKNVFSRSEQFIVLVKIDTRSDDINAIGGEIFFPKDLLAVDDIRSGDSIITFWIEKPVMDTHVKDPGRITFSGIIPGGFIGDEATLFSVVFRANKSSGASALDFGRIRIMENSDLGTEISIKAKSLAFVVDEGVALASTSIVSLPEDRDLPEEFVPLVTRDPKIFDGKYFVVFETADKGSGISHYEISEGDGGWKKADNPYRLKNQYLDVPIRIKAVDGSLNERVVLIPAQNQRKKYRDYNMFVIICASVLAILILKITWQKLKP